tara:strand:+ start:5240 stop:5536 length:297 start_codon:yes stop_codon:yes gene_type:complete
MKKPVNYKEFQESLLNNEPPKIWPEALKALWFDAKGNWEASHNIAQDMDSQIGSLIHAYLHRKEGDKFNAGYWYRQANKSLPEISFDAELKEIVESLL